MARNLELAWAAGLFEGEGCCRLGSSKHQHPVVSLVSTDEDVILRFAAAVERGNVRGYHRVSPERKDFWQWSVQSKDDVLHVLGLLFPLLGERRAEAASVAIERASKMNDGDGFCKRGHDLSDPANVYLHRKSGKRHCVPCRRRRSRESYQRLRGGGDLG